MRTHSDEPLPDSRARPSRVGHRPRRAAPYVHGTTAVAKNLHLADNEQEGTATRSTALAATTSRTAWSHERRRLEDHLQQVQKTEIIGRLATGIAHDLNIILMVILNNADLLSLRTSPVDPKRVYVEEIRDAVTRGTGLARQLTAFNRQRQFAPKTFDLNRTIDEMTTLLRRLIGSRIRLVSSLSPEVRSICADPTQIEQVILNLIINARDAMPTGGQMTIETAIVRDPVVEVELEPGDYVLLSVSDTGCGMSAAIKARVFDPLFTTKEEGRGTGLGLATVHGIVTRHGGAIQVESAEGRGSTFRIFLPRGESPAHGPDAA